MKSGDVIGLGAYKFAFEPDKGLTVDRFEQEIAIQARNIWVAVKERYLLQDISFSVRRGKLIGIMGPSGAGKTTMLYALLGLKKPAKGQTLLNGMDMVAEGVPTTKAAVHIASEAGIEMPIAEEVYRVLFEGKPPAEGVRDLMTRSAKDEGFDPQPDIGSRLQT